MPSRSAITAGLHPSAHSSRSSRSSGESGPFRWTGRWCIRGSSAQNARSSNTPLAFAELDAADLARQRLGQLVDELDDARIRVRGVALADEGRDLLAQLVGGLVAGRDHDEGLDDHPAPLVR